MKEDVTESAPRGAPMRLVGGLGAVGLLVLFLLQNLQDAEINFLWFEWNIPVIWALLASAAIGALAAFAFSTLRGRRPKA